jgi:glycosyltransferase involved in cell wall biosynthesis
MATYNGGEFIEQQLLSIAKQTQLVTELVVSDDKSTDGTIKIISNYSGIFNLPIKISINQENLGYIKNFDVALNRCTGDYIFLADQDDYWLPNKIERVLQVFRDNPSAVLVIHDLEFCDAALRPQKQTKIQRFRWSSTTLDHYVTGMATAIRGDFLKLCLPVPADSYTHDAWLHACARILGGRVVLPEVLALYRRHENNAAGNLAINHPGKLSPFFMVVRRLLNALFFDDASALRKEKERSRVLRNWMIAQKEALLASGFCAEIAYTQSLAKLEKDILVLQCRITIRQLNRMQRILPALRLHLGDGFGWRAFRNLLKDVVVK